MFLTEKDRIPSIALERLKSALAESNCRWQIISLDTSIALAIVDIEREAVPEMPDRIISATAQYLDIPLVTRDTKIQALKLETIW
jgi:PIN domain nuclease of toxin-antitoxin system